MEQSKTFISLFSIRLLSVIGAMAILPIQAWAAELVTGMNVNIQVWSPAQRDALLEQLAHPAKRPGKEGRVYTLHRISHT
ncbi:MAG: hypothetical protein JO308_03620 [Verrucomicrobia bacterium]|nr:hypothetical protein [Verrucomicrobiota bacterium]